MKFVIGGVLVLFVGFWMVQAPESLAQFTQDSLTWGWDQATKVFTGLIDYLDTLFA